MSTFNLNITNLLFLERKSYRKQPLRFLIGSLISAGLATLFLLALARYSDPTAKLVEFTLIPEETGLPRHKSTKSYINITTKVRNNNLFRAFNYTQGWIDLFYVANNNISKFSADTASDAQMHYQYIDPQYQRIQNVSTWKFDWYISSDTVNFTDLRANHSHFYAYLYLGYKYKIFMFWTTNTYYYQYLDAHFYLDYNQTTGGYNLHNQTPVKFHRPKDLRWAISA